MKNLKLIIISAIFCLFFTNSFGQDGNYSMLVVKQTSQVKSMKYSFSFEIKHYLGNGKEVDLTKDKSNIEMNTLVDILNELSNQGWKVINIYTFTNLMQDDVQTGMSPKNSIYYQYTLSKN